MMTIEVVAEPEDVANLLKLGLEPNIALKNQDLDDVKRIVARLVAHGISFKVYSDPGQVEIWVDET